VESYHPFSEPEAKVLSASVFRSGNIGNFRSEIPAGMLRDFETRFSSVDPTAHRALALAGPGAADNAGDHLSSVQQNLSRQMSITLRRTRLSMPEKVLDT